MSPIGTASPGQYRELVSTDGIDRASLMPYYHQLKMLLLEQIAADGLLPGDRLPGDHELCARYGVSRTVVRQALAELESEDVIVRHKGRGTFLAEPKTSQGLVQSLTGLYEDVRRHGRVLRSVVRRLETVPAEASVAHDLDLTPGSPVVKLDRLRFIDELPWVVVTTYLPVGLVPQLEREDLERGSLYEIMDRFGVRPVSGRRSVEARVANASLARDLAVPRGAPVLYLSSVGVGPSGRPVEAFQAYHRGDKSRFEVTLPQRSDDATAPTVVVV